MSYGERYGTGTLAKALRDIVEDICFDLDTNAPCSEVREDAKRLMEGAMELWERMVDEDE